MSLNSPMYGVPKALGWYFSCNQISLSILCGLLCKEYMVIETAEGKDFTSSGSSLLQLLLKARCAGWIHAPLLSTRLQFDNVIRT